ncbi:D-alanine--D-alanine ligase [bacterium]|nr:MAG: D-alanine--D-alanine ligase [bacterium]
MSAERDISLVTGASVAKALRASGHDVIEIDVGADLPAQLEKASPRSVFIALHGRWGEDGTVQGLLEIMGIPYTGSGVTASALAMDKVLSKVVFTAYGVPTPEFQVLGPSEGAKDVRLPAPLVAKPPREGSTIGIAIAKCEEEIAGAVHTARAHSKTVLIEKFIRGRELTVAVLDGKPLPIVEITPESGFYDYESKYTPGRTRYTCPAKLDAETAGKVSEAGRRAYEVLGCSGAARVDVLLDNNDNPWVLEVNTIPGMTPTSLLPKAAAAAGIDFETLVNKIVKEASLKA